MIADTPRPDPQLDTLQRFVIRTAQDKCVPTRGFSCCGQSADLYRSLQVPADGQGLSRPLTRLLSLLWSGS